ncbi:MAG: hypothetical protein A3G49_01150 [Candidatus Sungbacteria bacterium RIFCSPLOWO2_12_FULL_41_11]|uniref:Uncharacterized protein n=1 Tax=Candidatus Sungbacteria bacterium RIFCSPLOWO2_12_FULL_41_11 TaxID=1802286 RepID=A0A1G2LRE0_9BACT|nr:MAG: hypothetical protein A3G49_01150 [Candidatus Sungbacteria bacterium RIFCSPLOWO2_12_FULL_41_11]
MVIQGRNQNILVVAKNPVRPRKNTAEGGCGGNSAVFLQKIEAKPAALLVQGRTPKKSFVFLLKENDRAQIKNRKQNFSLVGASVSERRRGEATGFVQQFLIK